jgi:dTDP-4-amino-4,6-dideoxygalactose transaminase
MIPLVNLARQHEGLRREIEPALSRVLAAGEFALGRPVAQFEESFAAYCGTNFCVGVSSGTSAVSLALLAAGIGPGDEVITSAFTFVATVAAIVDAGAKPVLVDVSPDSLTVDPELIARAINSRTRAIVPVHLYGHPADMDPIVTIARNHGLAVIEDAAQAHGAEYKGRRAGSIGDAGCFSFYPTKNLGACGEAGAIVTQHEEWALRAKGLRNWGDSPRSSNCRMDAFQGAVLGVKLPYLDAWNNARRALADRYHASIDTAKPRPPLEQSWARSVFHIFAVRTLEREATIAEFRRRGIETRIHYPVPIHLMDRFQDLRYPEGSFPESEKAAREVLSIPIYPELTDDEVDAITEALREISLATQLRTAQQA